MTGSEKIDRVTILIESEIKKDKSASEIADIVAKQIGNTVRDLSTVFLFMTGKTLIQYIKDRKLNASYEHIIESEEFDAQTAVTLSGLGDQSALIKKYNSTYGMTPKEAFDKKDHSLLTLRMSWEDFSHVEIQEITEAENKPVARTNTAFGLTRKKYDEIREILELQESYGFDHLQSEIAYYIHQTYNYSLKTSFRFVGAYEYSETYEEIDDPELSDLLKLLDNCCFTSDEEDVAKLTREEYYKKIVQGDADDPEIRYAYFDVGIHSIAAIYLLIAKLHALGDNDITELEPELIKMCAYEDLDGRFCKKAVDYYLEHATAEYGEDAFDEYVEHLLNGMYLEDAFDSIWNTEGWDDYDSYDSYFSIDELKAELKREIEEYEQYESFEKWAAEETDYSDKYR